MIDEDGIVKRIESLGNQVRRISKTVATLAEYNLRDYGAYTDGVTDDTAALSAAIEAARLTSGGIVVFPEGVTLINAGGIVKDFTAKEGILIFRGSGNSRIRVTGDTTNKIFISNTRMVKLEHLTFIGTALQTTNAMRDYLFRFQTVDTVTVESCIFAGIRCVAVDSQVHGVFHLNNCNLIVKDSHFGGCGVNPSSCFRNLDWRSIYVENTKFVDFITVDNIYYVGGNLAHSWIGAVNVASSFDSQMFTVRNCNFDEGTQHACYLYNGGTLDVDGGFTNHGISPAFSVELAGRKMRIANMKVKTPTDTAVNRAWASVENLAKAAEFENVQCSNNSRHIWVQGTSPQIKVRNSTLNAEATYPTGIRNTANAVVDYDDKVITTVGDANYTATIANDLISFNTTLTAARTLNLPTAVGIKGKTYLIKTASVGAFSVIVDPAGAELIDGAATKSIAVSYGSMRVISDGVGWISFG